MYMNKTAIAAVMMLLFGVQGFGGELDIKKGFFNVPWGSSPEEAMRLLDLNKNQLEKKESGVSGCTINFTRNGTTSYLEFYNGKLISFRRDVVFDVSTIPDAKYKGVSEWSDIFTKMFKEKFKDIDGISYDATATRSRINDNPPELEIYLSVTNEKLKKEADEDKKLKTENAVKAACDKLLNQ